MGDTKLASLIVAFLGIVIGIALLGSIADSVWVTNNAEIISNERVDLTGSIAVKDANGSSTMVEDNTISLANDNIDSISVFRINGTALTSGTDYTINLPAGTLKILNTTTTNTINFTVNSGNISMWNYTHGDNYIQDSASRTLLGLLPLFYVIGLLLLIIAGIFYKNEISELFKK